VGFRQVLRYSGLDGPTDWDTRWWAVTEPEQFRLRFTRTQPELALRGSAGAGQQLDFFLGTRWSRTALPVEI